MAERKYISSDEWGRIQGSLGVRRAADWRQKNGIQVSDEAASPSDHFGGSAEMALPSDFAMEGGELPPQSEDEYNDASASLAARPLEADEASLAVPGGRASTLAAKGADVLEGSRRNITQLYEQAAERLKGLYHAPTTGEMLIAMGAQLMKPTASGSFGEALGNALGVVPEYMKNKREYSNAYGKELADLQKSYMTGITGLEGRYITASGKLPPAGHASADALGVKFWTSGPLTGMPIAPPDRIAGLLQYQNDPAAKAAFNASYGPNAADVYIAQFGGSQ